MNWSDVLKFVAENFQVISLVGAGFAFYKWHVSQKQKDAELLLMAVRRLRSGSVRKFINLLDYDKKWYGPSFHSGESERLVDEALSYFSYVCYLRQNHLISKAVFNFFGYEIKLVCCNQDVQDYFYNLFWDSRRYKLEFPFRALLDFGLKHSYIDKEIVESSELHKRKPDLFHEYLSVSVVK